MSRITDMLMKLFRLLGIDKAIFYTSSTQALQAVGSLLSIFFIMKFLTVEEQGFYYTFGSLVAVQTFFELGLNGIITQFVAHEAAHLQWDKMNNLSGNTKYLSRLSSLLYFSVKWYSIFAVLLFIVLIIVGFSFFSHYNRNTDIVWQFPWVLLAIGTVLLFLLSPFLAFLEGLGKVKEIAKFRLFQRFIMIFILCGGLLTGLKLYVVGINAILGALFLIFSLFFSDLSKVIFQIRKIRIVEKVDYKKEIFPYQWKIALSWISGYFIFQLFNPVLFATEGAVVAGQMGITIAALNGIQSLSISWMGTKVPYFSTLIARNEYGELDFVFNKTLRQLLFVNGGLLFVFLAVLCVLREFNVVILGLDIGSRFLDYIPLIMMMLALFLNQFVFSWAMYLRCHKKEPFLLISIMGGVLSCLSTLILGYYYGVNGVSGGYLTITFILFIWAYKVFEYKKREWHNN